MAGGAPAGINILPGDAGCLTKSTSIRMTTMQGKSTTTPKGTEMLELPLNLRGLRKKARREAKRLLGRIVDDVDVDVVDVVVVDVDENGDDLSLSSTIGSGEPAE